jgi:hypothetical protein
VPEIASVVASLSATGVQPVSVTLSPAAGGTYEGELRAKPGAYTLTVIASSADKVTHYSGQTNLDLKSGAVADAAVVLKRPTGDISVTCEPDPWEFAPDLVARHPYAFEALVTDTVTGAQRKLSDFSTDAYAPLVQFDSGFSRPARTIDYAALTLREADDTVHHIWLSALARVSRGSGRDSDTFRLADGTTLTGSWVGRYPRVSYDEETTSDLDFSIEGLASPTEPRRIAAAKVAGVEILRSGADTALKQDVAAFLADKPQATIELSDGKVSQCQFVFMVDRASAYCRTYWYRNFWPAVRAWTPAGATEDLPLENLTAIEFTADDGDHVTAIVELKYPPDQTVRRELLSFDTSHGGGWGYDDYGDRVVGFTPYGAVSYPIARVRRIQFAS